MRIILILIVLLLLKYCTTHSQSYNVTHYNEQSGLNNSAVWSVAQDLDGKMWFATKKGFSIYDGINWNTDNYSYQAVGPDNLKLSTDEKGYIWSITRNIDIFISCFNGTQRFSIFQSPHFSRSSITSFIIDTINSKRFIFVSGHLGEILYCYDTTWKALNVPAETEISSIHSAIRMDDYIMLATDKGLYKFTMSGNLSKLQIDLPFIPNGLLLESGNRLLVGGGRFFGYIENNKFNKITDKLIITYDENIPTLLITPDKKGGYFIYNQFSLNYYSAFENSLITLGTINGLIADGATSVLVDFEKNVWITTLRGVSKLITRTFLNYNDVFRHPENDISALAEYQPGKIVFGDQRGLFFNNGKEYNYVPLIDSVYKEQSGLIRTLDIYKDNDENIWVATFLNGFFVIDRNFKKRAFEKSGSIEGLSTSIQQDDDGLIWLATTRHLYTFNGKEVSKPNEFPNEFNVRKIVKLRNKTLLFCAVGMGVFLKSENGVKQYTSADNNFKNTFSAYQDINGRVFVGTAGGLCEIKNDSIVKCTLNNNLTVDRPVYLILKDSTNNLWLGTDLGVIRYDGNKIFTYTTKDGFAGNEVNRSAGVVDLNKRVWFGTNNGVSCYLREYDSKNDTTIFSPVIIKNINSKHTTNPGNTKTEFNHNDNNITFLISGVSFIDEKENKIRWKLEGVDYDWVTERPFLSNELFFDNLSPGTYKLFVQMKNANGTWGPVTISPEITINKPFYLRWWFLFICVIAFGGVVYSVQHYFEQQKYSYFLKREIDRVTKELKETETNYRETLLKEIHHRVKNNMQIISSLLSLQSSREPDVHLSEVIKESQNRIRSMALIHEKLYQSKKFSELDISSYVGSLVEYLKRVFLVNTAFVKVNLNIEAVYINIDVAIACGLIINELVSNSFKYAFPNNAKGTIFIEIRKQEKDTLFISVKDDGIGIKNLSGLDDTASLGLKLVKMLVKQHRGNYNVFNNEGALFEIKLIMQNENIRET